MGDFKNIKNYETYGINKIGEIKDYRTGKIIPQYTNPLSLSVSVRSISLEYISTGVVHIHMSEISLINGYHVFIDTAKSFTY